MKKIGKRLSNLVKMLMAFGLLFNNLMPLSVVLADELDNNDEVIVGEGTGSEENENGEEEKPSEGTGAPEGYNPDDEGNGEDDENNSEEVVFTAVLNDENQIVITYNGEYPEEGCTLEISEKLTYLDGTDSGEASASIEVDDAIKAELSEGYALTSATLEENYYPGDYVATITLGENTATINEKIEFEGDIDLEFDVLAFYEDEWWGNGIVPNDDGKYPVDPEASVVELVAFAGQNHSCPSMKFTYGEDEYTAEEIMNGILLEEFEIAGHLHGEFSFGLASTFTGCNGKTTEYNENRILVLGEYQDNTDKINESAKNVGLDTKYQFFGDTAEGYVYNLAEINKEEIESILEDAFGDSEYVEYEVTYENEELSITITDELGIEVTYSGVKESSDTTIDARLEVDSSEVTTGDTFTVSYLVTVKDYMVNGVSGLVTYDENLLRLVDVSASEFTGSAEEGKFTFLGNPLSGTEKTDEENNVTYEDAEYLVVTLTFEALASGEASMAIEDAKFYNEGVYYEASNEISASVIINESDDSSLTSLSVAGQDIELQDDVLEYSITVGNDVTSPDIAADVAAGANITSIIAPEELAVGANEITIEVTAENGDVKVYTIIVNREAAAEENNSNDNTVSQMSYNNDTVADDNTEDAETTIAPAPSDDDSKTTGETDDENNGKKTSRLLVIILILLAIAGLIYLIFKDDDDDEETKKANKDIERLRKEEPKEEYKNSTKKVDNHKKPNKKGR